MQKVLGFFFSSDWILRKEKSEFMLTVNSLITAGVIETYAK
jgi:hypothetical protein